MNGGRKESMYTKDIMLILAASFFYFASPMLATPLITGFAGSIGASAALMGMIGGMMNLCSLFCRPFVGNLADRISKYKVSFIGAALMSLSCVGYIAADTPAVVVTARIINGVGFACCSVCMSTWMSNMLPKEKVGSGMGVYGMMNALGMAVAPGIGVSVYQRFGYRPAFGIALVFSIMTGVVIQFISDRGEPADEKDLHVRKRIQLMDRKVLPIAAIIMLFAIPYCATQSFIVTYTETRGIPVEVSLFFPLYAAALLVLRFFMKGLFDRLRFRTFLIGSAASSFAGILLLGMMNNNALMFLAAVLMAGGYGIMSSVCQSTAILLAGPEHRGLANSTYYIGLDLGMTLGPVIGGFLYGHLDIRLFYPALLATVPLALAVYVLTMRRGRKCRENKAEV